MSFFLNFVIGTTYPHWTLRCIPDFSFSEWRTFGLAHVLGRSWSLSYNYLLHLIRFLQDSSIQQGILQFRENVTQISALHTQSIDAVGEVSRTEQDEIDSLTERTRTLMQDLKQRIKRLESAPQQQDAQLRNNRVAFLLLKFINPLWILSFQDKSFKVKISWSHTRLSTRRTRKPGQIQAESGETVENRQDFDQLFVACFV